MFKKKNNLPPFPVLDKIGTIDEYLEEKAKQCQTNK